MTAVKQASPVQRSLLRYQCQRSRVGGAGAIGLMAAGRLARRSELAAEVHQGIVAGPARVILKLAAPSE
jgi:hypothetical protein